MAERADNQGPLAQTDRGEEEKPTITRANLYRILPQYIICDPADNSRRSAARRPMDELVTSILERGQLEPITVRRDRDGSLRCVFGFRRVAAIAKINNERLMPADRPEPIPVTYQIVAATDEQAFVRNLAENLVREDLSPMEKADAIDRLQVAFGRTGEQVAKIMGKSPGWVSQTRRLLDLPKDVQAKVHSGEIPASVAYEMLGMGIDQQKRIANGLANGPRVIATQAAEPMPRINSGAARPVERSEAAAEPRPVVTRERVRQAKRDDSDIDTGPVPKTRKEIVQFWTELAESAVAEEREAAQLAEAVVKHHEGELTDRQLLNRVVKAVR